MARGWESKSVESQIEDAGVSLGLAPVESLSPEQRVTRQKRDSVELSRRRVLQDLGAARSEMRRTALERALAFLDEELKKLGA